jgi:prophage regulatory protein
MDMEIPRIVRLPKVLSMIGIRSRATLLAWEKEGKFPKRLRLGKRSMGWLLKDIEEWIKSKNE